MANIVPRREEGGGISGGGRWRDLPAAWRDPFEAMRDLLNLEGFTGGGLVGGGTFLAPFEVKETKDSYIFKADLPGVKEDDLEVSVTGNRLTISGKREAEQKEEKERYFAYERSYGTFSRSFTLPDGADTEHIQADLRNGVLNVVLPKKPEVQPKKVTVTAGRKDEKAPARA
jgi:HSP20 family protein